MGAVMNPHTMGKLFLEGKMDIFAIFDGLYLTIVIGLTILVFMPMFRTLNNVIHQTDEILNLKKANFQTTKPQMMTKTTKVEARRRQKY